MYKSLQLVGEKVRSPNNNYVKFFKVFVCLSVVLLFLWSNSYSTGKKDNEFSVDSDKKFKNILIWNQFWGDPTFEFGLGVEPFHTHNCSVQKCMIVYDAKKIDVENYDAVVFHGPEFNPRYRHDYPAKRSTFQRYVYFSMESPLTRPLSTKVDTFFNWTMSYRLDSDILVMYFAFYDIKTNTMVSNTNNPQWKEITINQTSLKEREVIMKSKKKTVAWFVSNCHSKNKRKAIVKDLLKYTNVDVYGKCGPLKCLRDDPETCNYMLKKDYYFYLSFENSNCLDYITEKQATAYSNDVIPVYYGGVDAVRFLPPHSYIDARNMTAKELADRMKYLIENPKEYLEYFWWKDFYRLDTREVASYKPFCKLCEMLHDESLPSKTYNDFYHWWNTYDGQNVCNNAA